MKPYIKFVTAVGMAILLASGMACSHKRKLLVPLALEGAVQPQATQLTEQGTQAYQAKQFEEARQYFEQAMAAEPQSGQAHYNYALALNALGDAEVRQMLKAYDKQIEQGQVDYQKMFQMVKQKLVRERGIIL